MINHEKLHKIEEAYLGYLPDYWSSESCKWKAIKQFQDHWDIEASDFAAMLEQALSKTYNLLASGYYSAKAMRLGFAGEDPNGVREAFRILYDETRDLGERIERFTAYAEDRKQNHNDSGWKNHYAKTTEEAEPFLSVNMGGNLIEVRSLDLNSSFREISASLDSITASRFGEDLQKIA